MRATIPFIQETFTRYNAMYFDDTSPLQAVRHQDGGTTVGKNWYDEIFNYFDYKYTNVITESINNLIKSMEMAGRGYTFEVLRAKMLFGTTATKKPVYRAKPREKEGYMYYAATNNLFDDVELERGSLVSLDANLEILQTPLCFEQKP